MSALTGCTAHVAPPRPLLMPPIGEKQAPAPKPHQTLLQSGLRIIHMPSKSEDTKVGIFFTGGAIDDPTTGTGLTSFLADAGLTSSPKEDLHPSKEALSLGTNVTAFSDNTVFGWSMHTSDKDLTQALKILRRIATRDRFDSSELSQLTARAADELTGFSDPGVQQALAVAVSSALGLSLPRGIYGDANHFRKFTTTDVEKHWRRMVTPHRAALVIAGGQKDSVEALARTLFGSWRPQRLTSPPLTSCWPDRTTAHLVVDPTATSRRVYTLVALRVPSLGEPGRKEIELVLETLGRVPGGRLAKVLGDSKARDISPHIVDLGWNGGDKGSVLLMRLSGPSRETLRALWDVIETLNGIASHPPTPDEVARARRHLDEQLSREGTTAFSRLRTVAKERLYGTSDYKEEDLTAHAQAVFRRRNVSVTGVGPNPLGPVLSELGALTVWDSGGLVLEGNNRPGCP